MALVTEVQLGILRGELDVPQKIEQGLAASGAFLFDPTLKTFLLFFFCGLLSEKTECRTSREAC